MKISYKMKPVYCLCIFTAVLLLQFGCTQPTYIPLRPENASKIHATKAYSVIGQEEVAVKVNESKVAYATGGGLIPALIDMAITSHRSKKAEERVAPLRKAVSDFDLREEFWGQLRSELKNPSRLNITDIATTVRPLSKDEPKRMINEINEDALLTVTTDYSLSPDFRVLSIDSVVSLWLKGEKDPVYLEKIAYDSPQISSEESEAAIAKWTENNGALYRDTLRQGIQETMKMLRLKLLSNGG